MGKNRKKAKYVTDLKPVPIVTEEIDEPEEVQEETPIESEPKEEIKPIEEKKVVSTEEETVEEEKIDDNEEEETLAEDVEENKEKLSTKDTLVKKFTETKFLAIFGSIVGLLVLLPVIVLLLKLDSFIFPSSIEGVLTNDAGEPLSAVEVCIQDKCTVTLENGSFSFEKLKYGNHSITATKTDFKDINKEVNLKRGENELKLKMFLRGTGGVAGSVLFLDSLNTTDMVVSIDDISGVVNIDGTFEIIKVPAGEKEILISSPYYVDIKLSIDVEEGENLLEPIELEPAGDIKVTLVDWINELPVKNAEVTVGDIKITENTEGVYTVKDLEVQNTTPLELTISLPDYNQKVIPVNSIVQGNNDQGIVNLVREGRLVYVSNKSGNSNVYSVNYDGTEEALVSNVGNDSYSPVVFDNETKVGFITDKDNFKNQYNNTIYLPYTATIFGENIANQAKTKYESNNGQVGTVNYYAGLRAFVIREYPDYVLYVGTIDGNNLKKIATAGTGSGSIYSIVFSEDGTYVGYTLYDGYTNSYKVYVSKSDASEKKEVFTFVQGESVIITGFAPDNSSVVVRVFDNSQETNIWKVRLSDSKGEKLTANSTQENNAQFSKDGTRVAFTSPRDSRVNLYVLDLNTLTETQVSTGGKVTDFYWNKDGLISYRKEEDLWIVDPIAPDKAKKVVGPVGGYGYLGSGYYYGY